MLPLHTVTAHLDYARYPLPVPTPHLHSSLVLRLFTRLRFATRIPVGSAFAPFHNTFAHTARLPQHLRTLHRCPRHTFHYAPYVLLPRFTHFTRTFATFAYTTHRRLLPRARYRVYVTLRFVVVAFYVPAVFYVLYRLRLLPAHATFTAQFAVRCRTLRSVVTFAFAAVAPRLRTCRSAFAVRRLRLWLLRFYVGLPVRLFYRSGCSGSCLSVYTVCGLRLHFTRFTRLLCGLRYCVLTHTGLRVYTLSLRLHVCVYTRLRFAHTRTVALRARHYRYARLPFTLFPFACVYIAFTVTLPTYTRLPSVTLTWFWVWLRSPCYAARVTGYGSVHYRLTVALHTHVYTHVACGCYTFTVYAFTGYLYSLLRCGYSTARFVRLYLRSTFTVLTVGYCAILPTTPFCGYGCVHVGYFGYGSLPFGLRLVGLPVTVTHTRLRLPHYAHTHGYGCSVTAHTVRCGYRVYAHRFTCLRYCWLRLLHISAVYGYTRTRIRHRFYRLPVRTTPLRCYGCAVLLHCGWFTTTPHFTAVPLPVTTGYWLHCMTAVAGLVGFYPTAYHSCGYPTVRCVHTARFTVLVCCVLAVLVTTV